MTTQHLPVPPHPLRDLLVAGPRLGWTYHDAAAAMEPFAEAQPVPPPPNVLGNPATSGLGRRIAVTAVLGFGLAALAGCCGFLASGPSGTTSLGAQIVVFAVLLALGTAALIAFLVWRDRTRVAAVTAPQRAYQAALAAWQQRAAAHQAAEQARLAGLPRWESAGPAPGATRLDIFGGTPAAWRDLLTVAGAGYLASHGPSTILDLTGDQAGQDLRDLAVAAGISVDWQTPPGDCDLLTGLDSAQLVDVLVESVHGDGDRDVRSQRAADTRILTAVVEALGDHVDLLRVGDALRVLLRLPGQTPALTATERQHIADELFPPDYLTAAAGSLHRLEAHLHSLRGLTTRPRPAAVLTIMGGVSDGTSARSELLDDLIVAWITRRVASRPDLCRTLVVAGADHLPARQVERLADSCARHGVTLILLWRHLRDGAHLALGSGAVAFMRLRHGDEATRAADFIGRQHRFVLAGFTRTVGGSTTQTDTTGTSDAVSTGSSRSLSHGGRIAALIDHAQAWTRSQGTTTGNTRTVSHQSSTATGTSWSDATSEQRVYEYAVEPTVLQGLPEHAVLLVDHTPQGILVRALDCNPAIVTLPGVSMLPGQTIPPTVPRPRPAPALGHAPPQTGVAGHPPLRVPQQRTELWSDPEQ